MAKQPILAVPTKESSRARRVVWLAGSALMVLLGLNLFVGMVIVSASYTDDLVSLMFNLPQLMLGALYMTTGVMTALRVSGLKPELRIKLIIAMTLALTTMLSMLGVPVMLAVWVLSRSVWINEGGDASTASNEALIVAGACAVVALISLILTILASKIDDPPRPGAAGPPMPPPPTPPT